MQRLFIIAALVIVLQCQGALGFGETVLTNGTYVQGSMTVPSTGEAWQYYRLDILKLQAMQIVVTTDAVAPVQFAIYLQSAMKPEADNFYDRQNAPENIVGVQGINTGYMVQATTREEASFGRWYLGIRAVLGSGSTTATTITFRILVDIGPQLCGFPEGLTFCSNVAVYSSVLNPDPLLRERAAQTKYDLNQEIDTVRDGGGHCQAMNANWTCAGEFRECDSDGFPKGVCASFCSDWATECLDRTFQESCSSDKVVLGPRGDCTDLARPPPGIGLGVIIAISVSAVIIVAVAIGAGVGWWRHRRMRREMMAARMERRRRRAQGGRGRGPEQQFPEVAFSTATVLVPRAPPPAAPTNEALGIPYRGSTDSSSEEDSDDAHLDIHVESPHTPSGLNDSSASLSGTPPLHHTGTTQRVTNSDSDDSVSDIPL